MHPAGVAPAGRFPPFPQNGLGPGDSFSGRNTDCDVFPHAGAYRSASVCNSSRTHSDGIAAAHRRPIRICFLSRILVRLRILEFFRFRRQLFVHCDSNARPNTDTDTNANANANANADTNTNSDTDAISR